MKNIVLAITSAISIFAILFIVFAYFERPTSNFKNYEEMVASGIIDAGWVTKHIPKSAHDISEQHDLDTNKVDVYFKYEASESEMAVDGCTLIVQNQIGKKYICPPLEGKSSILTLRHDGVGMYQSVRDGLY
jgi:hypothetical protein